MNTPVNRRRTTTNHSRSGSILSVLVGGGGGSSGSDHRTLPNTTTHGHDLKASILSNLQNEKINKRKAKRQTRQTFG